MSDQISGYRGNQWWDLWFLGMADYVSTASKDPSTKVGSVLVRPDRTLASIGFNGFPRGLSDAPELYADRDYKIATVRHSEENAIGFAKDQSLEGHTLYVSGLPPCCSCASEIIQVGIARVVARHNMVPARWVRNMSWAIDNMLAKGIVVDTYDGHTGTWHEITRPTDLWLEPEPELPVASFSPASCSCPA